MFNETQRFNQPWLLFFLVVPLFRPLHILYHRGVQAMFHKLTEPEWLVGLLITSVIILFLFWGVSLKTNINKTGISVRFFPFHRKERFYNWDQINNCYVRQYRPLLEYGGWGIRFGTNGTAYNIRGNKGIQLKLKNGREILIGTQKPDEASKQITQYFKTENTSA